MTIEEIAELYECEVDELKDWALFVSRETDAESIARAIDEFANDQNKSASHIIGTIDYESIGVSAPEGARFNNKHLESKLSSLMKRVQYEVMAYGGDSAIMRRGYNLRVCSKSEVPSAIADGFYQCRLITYRQERRRW